MAKAAKVVWVLRWDEEMKVAVVQADTLGSGCEVHLLDGLCLLQDLEGCFPGHY